jgi:hypothetical protein
MGAIPVVDVVHGCSVATMVDGSERRDASTPTASDLALVRRPDIPEDPSADGRPRRVGKVDVSNVGVAATLLGLASYSLARFLLDGFLSPFHLTFQDVGLDYVDLVGAGALILVPTVVILLTVLKVADHVAVMLEGPVSRGSEYFRRNSRTVAAMLFAGAVQGFLLAALLAIWLVLVSLLNLVPEPEGNLTVAKSVAQTSLTAILGVAIYLIVRDAKDFIRSSRPARSSDVAPSGGAPPQLDGTMRVGAEVKAGLRYVATAASLCVVCVVAHYSGSRYAHSVQSGERLEVTVAGLQIPGLLARPVQLYQPDAKAELPVLTGRCTLLLGVRDGTMLFYLKDRQQILRMSAENVSIVESATTRAC